MPCSFLLPSAVYGVLPSSIIFLFLYSWGTQRFSRERLFNIILGFFVTFFAGENASCVIYS